MVRKFMNYIFLSSIFFRTPSLCEAITLQKQTGKYKDNAGVHDVFINSSIIFFKNIFISTQPYKMLHSSWIDKKLIVLLMKGEFKNCVVRLL